MEGDHAFVSRMSLFCHGRTKTCRTYLFLAWFRRHAACLFLPLLFHSKAPNNVNGHLLLFFSSDGYDRADTNDPTDGPLLCGFPFSFLHLSLYHRGHFLFFFVRCHLHVREVEQDRTGQKKSACLVLFV